jgi:aspartate aminotransferase
VFSAEEIAGIAGVLERNPHVLAISDEIYELIQFEGRSPSLAAHASISDRVMTVNGVSKGFAMTGWRLGYIAAPQWIADACSKIQGQVTSAPCSIAQVAAEAAVSADPSIADGMREAFLRRRNLVLEKVAEIPGWKSHRPNGAFYLFPDVSGWLGKSYQGQVLKDGDDVALFLLSAAQVAVVGGPAFGTPECIRISYAAADDVLLEAMNRIIAAAKLLE